MRTVTPMSSVGFSSFDDFLKTTAGDDRQFLAEDELNRFSPAVCGMANGAGGWVVVGASVELGDDTDAPHVTGINGVESLLGRLEERMRSGTFSSPVGFTSRVIDGGSPLLVFRIEPSEWPDRPVCVGGDYLTGVWRRIEGIDVISGLKSRFRLAFDSLERLRSDGTAAESVESALHEDSAASFRDEVLRVRPEWANLPQTSFLRRTLVMSGDKLTRHGLFLLGRQGVRVRAETGSDIFEVRNLWKAWTDILPRISSGLSDRCAAALRECFLNAMLHADYDDGRGIIIRCTGRFIVVQNPGLSRTYTRGVSSCRNFRLMKIFRLIGAAEGTGRGLAAIRRYQPDFSLDQDATELSTAAILRRESAESVKAEAVRAERPSARPRVAFAQPTAEHEPQPAAQAEPKADGLKSAETETSAPQDTGIEWLLMPSSDTAYEQETPKEADAAAEPQTASAAPDTTDVPEQDEGLDETSEAETERPTPEEDSKAGHTEVREEERLETREAERREPREVVTTKMPDVVLALSEDEPLPQLSVDEQTDERSSSFGSAAEDLERSIAEMREKMRARKNN